MPVDLHQRLSEFSYGYGVTREAEKLLKMVGLETTPFLPSLKDEGKLGFDVAFDRPGLPLLLQFKMGEALRRYRRNDTSKPPPLWGGHWRFHVDTAEPDGQFDLLLKAERAGAEVYYVAPRFTTWDNYVAAFEEEHILEKSLLLTPCEIDQKLARQGEADGWHRIAYDFSKVVVCSEPIQLEERPFEHLGHTIRSQIEQRGIRTDVALRRAFSALGETRQIRVSTASVDQPDGISAELHIREGAKIDRDHRLDDLRARSDREEDALFAAIGVEAWAAGAQLIAVTLPR